MTITISGGGAAGYSPLHTPLSHIGIYKEFGSITVNTVWLQSRRLQHI